MANSPSVINAPDVDMDKVREVVSEFFPHLEPSEWVGYGVSGSSEYFMMGDIWFRILHIWDENFDDNEELIDKEYKLSVIVMSCHPKSISVNVEPGADWVATARSVAEFFDSIYNL